MTPVLLDCWKCSCANNKLFKCSKFHMLSSLYIAKAKALRIWKRGKMHFAIYMMTVCQLALIPGQLLSFISSTKCTWDQSSLTRLQIRSIYANSFGKNMPYIASQLIWNYICAIVTNKKLILRAVSPMHENGRVKEISLFLFKFWLNLDRILLFILLYIICACAVELKLLKLKL